MPSAILNKQPIFTATPIIVSSYFNPTIATSLYNTSVVNIIYNDTSTYGSLITRIRVTATAVISGRVTSKRIYLYIEALPGQGLYNVYKSAFMQGVEPVALGDTVPYVEFFFEGGLLLPPGQGLAIASTTNSTSTGFAGDNITVTVEGGTYDQPV